METWSLRNRENECNGSPRKSMVGRCIVYWNCPLLSRLVFRGVRWFFTDWDPMGWTSPSFTTIWDHIFWSTFSKHFHSKFNETMVPSWFPQCWAPMISTKLLDLVTKTDAPQSNSQFLIFFKPKFLHFFTKFLSSSKSSKTSQLEFTWHSWIGANSLNPTYLTRNWKTCDLSQEAAIRCVNAGILTWSWWKKSGDQQLRLVYSLSQFFMGFHI